MPLKRIATAFILQFILLHATNGSAEVLLGNAGTGFVFGADTKIKGDNRLYRLSGPAASASLMLSTSQPGRYFGAFATTDYLENNYHTAAAKEVMRTKIYGLAYGLAAPEYMASLSLGIGVATTVITQSAPVKRIDTYSGWAGRINGEIGILGSPVAHVFLGFDACYRLFISGHEIGNANTKLRTFTQLSVPVMIGLGSSL
jgi:hypothetical protein